MQFVAIKGIDQQAADIAFPTRDLFIRQKTQTILRFAAILPNMVSSPLQA